MMMSDWPRFADDEAIGPVFPGQRRWADFAAHCVANSKSVELLREAARKRYLGAVLTDHDNEELGYQCRSTQYRKKIPTANPRLVDVVLPYDNAIPAGFALLRIDALIALESMDAQRCASDIEAILGMINHLFEVRYPSTHLTAWCFLTQTYELIASVLDLRPEVLADQEWTSLAHKLSEFNADDVFSKYIAFRRLVFEDLIQRVYTDGGNGSGRLTQPDDSLRYYMRDPAFYSFTDNFETSPNLFDRALFPFMSAAIASRSEILAEFDALMKLNIQYQSTPLWMRDKPMADEITIKWQEDRRWLRFLPLDLFYTSMSNVISESDISLQQRDGTLVAIAMELYHRKTGDYPLTLNQLVPQFLPTVPPDRYDGKPLRYKLVKDHPVLYSIGVDRIDSGGSPPKAKDPLLANIWARGWEPPSRVAEALKNKLIRRGDWVLWPPVDY